MKRIHVWMSLLALLVAVMLCGCGGGSDSGSGPSSPGLPIMPGTSMRVGADTGAASRGQALLAKLYPGATVEVFNFATAQKIATTTIGDDGFGKTTVSPGLSIAVIVTGERDGKSYRLSAIVPMVPTGDFEVILTPASTLAAEAIAQKYYGRSAIDQGTVDAVHAEASQYLAAHPDGDIALGEGLLNSGSTFGGINALDTSELATVIAAVPATIDNDVIKAKNAIQQVKDAGLPLQSVQMEEYPSLQAIYPSCSQAFSSVDFDAVALKYGSLMSRLNEFIIPVVSGDFYYDGMDLLSPPNLFDLSMGTGYRAISSGEPGSRLIITPDHTLDVANQITVVFAISPTETYTLIAKRPSTGMWNVVQTSSADAALRYEFTTPDSLPSGLNPNLQCSISVKDKDVTTPIEFVGTLVATGPDAWHYTNIQFGGQLTSAELTAGGTFTAQFPSSLPAGADDDKSIYDYPTAFSVTDAAISYNAGGLTASISGEFSAKAEIKSINGKSTVVPTEFKVTDGSLSVAAQGHSITFTRNLIVKLTYQASDGRLITIPTQFTSDAGMTIETGTTTLHMGGGVDIRGKAVTIKGTPQSVPTFVSINGEYANSETEQAFSGNITARWDNPDETTDISSLRGSVTITGEMTRGSYHAYDIDIIFTADGQQHLNCEVRKIGFGSFYLTGSASGTLTGSSSGGWNITDGQVTLTNQDGVTITLTTTSTNELQGAITVKGREVASITKDSLRDDGYLITFVDGATERF